MTQATARDQRQKIGHTVRALRRVARTGAVMGVLLSTILTAWLFMANREPSLDRFAGIRNAAAAAALLLAALIPIARFRNSAKEIIPAATIGLGMTCVCYKAWTVYFERLADRMGAFQIFVMGMAVYGLAAALLWLGSLLRSARHHHHLALQPAVRRRR